MLLCLDYLWGVGGRETREGYCTQLEVIWMGHEFHAHYLVVTPMLHLLFRMNGHFLLYSLSSLEEVWWIAEWTVLPFVPWSHRQNSGEKTKKESSLGHEDTGKIPNSFSLVTIKPV